MSAAIDKCFCSSLKGMRVSGVILEMTCPKCVEELVQAKNDVTKECHDLKAENEELRKMVKQLMEDE